MSLTEKGLKDILDDKFKAQNKLLETMLIPYEEARKQVWKNEKEILVIRTEKETIKWGLVTIYGCIMAVGCLVTIFTTLHFLKK